MIQEGIDAYKKIINRLAKSTLSLYIICFLCGFLLLRSCNKIDNQYITYGNNIIQPGKSKILELKENTVSIDGVVDIHLSCHDKSGEIKLINGRSWYDYENELLLSIKEERITTWEYNIFGELEKKIINNIDGIKVDKEGIILEAPFNRKFHDYVKKDMYIEIKNLSDHKIHLNIEWFYR